MSPDRWVVLHAGQGPLTVIDYLARLVLHLVAIGVGGIVLWWVLHSDGG
jgi:hypothetical protein